ncbi:MAG: UDP-N-acetylglucosamine 1-carboxyvinyltransferase [Patescibacteria group bacterium]|jgi:UDP-N-acetylglucosamine 1-carboxyvinyltransferase|nr:UDP-N-acetylglucosamine 1-carboxyvinyltransferase [Patescibacteria group bacterium]
MSKFIIKGNKKLKGEISVSGAKNNAQIMMPASILSSNEMILKNMPRIDGVEKSIELLKSLGAEIEDKGRTIKIKTEKLDKTDLDYKIADKFRTSVMFVGPLLARFKKVNFPHPGGCVIGAAGRPIDLFLEGFRALGAEVEMGENFYHIKANKLKGCDFFFTTATVTGTQSMIMTATLAEGKTILRNCAMEPEVEALVKYLNKQGAKIKGAGSPTIIIEGIKKLSAGICQIIPDRIEAGSFALLAAASNSEIKINKCEPEHLLSLLAVFDKIGVNYERGNDYIFVKKSKKIIARDIKTHEYPGFSTDLQSPYIVLMTQAHGSCLIQENIYDRRLIWTDMLSQMGANIVMCDPHRVVVSGPSKLQAKKLISPDIRAGIALVIAALIAKGTTEIDNIYQIDRGYEKLDERLRSLGADIKRIEINS